MKRNETPALFFKKFKLENTENIFQQCCQGSIPKPLIVAVADNNPDLVGAVGLGNNKTL